MSLLKNSGLSALSIKQASSSTRRRAPTWLLESYILNKVLYICHYLIWTSTYSLVYNGGSSVGLTACTNSDWGSDPTSCLSQTGFYLKLADGLISWTSYPQKTIAYSFTEAEYMALSDCTHQVTWIWSLLGELSYKLSAILICSDNQGSIFMASNPVMEPHSK